MSIRVDASIATMVEDVDPMLNKWLPRLTLCGSHTSWQKSQIDSGSTNNSCQGGKKQTRSFLPSILPVSPNRGVVVSGRKDKGQAALDHHRTCRQLLLTWEK